MVNPAVSLIQDQQPIKSHAPKNGCQDRWLCERNGMDRLILTRVGVTSALPFVNWRRHVLALQIGRLLCFSRVVLIFVCIVLLAGCSDNHGKAANSAQAAFAALQAGKLDEAEELALDAVALRDSEAEYWELLGQIQLSKQDMKGAYASNLRVVELDASNLQALQLVAEIAFQISDYRQAETMVDRILVLAPDSTRGLLVKGLLALERKKADEAQGVAERLLKVDPQNEFGVVLIARSLALKGQFLDAIAVVKTRIEPDRRTEASLMTLIELNRYAGDLDELNSAFLQMIAKQPKQLQFVIDFAALQYRVGNGSEARRRLFGVLVSPSASFAMVEEIMSLWREFDFNPLTEKEKAQIAASGTADVRLAVAGFFLDQKDARLTSTLLAPLIASDSSARIVQAQALQSTAHLLRGDLDAAETQAADVLKEDDTNIDARLTRGAVRRKRNDLNGALEDAQLAVSNAPSNENARIFLTAVMFQRNGLAAAVKSIEDGLSFMPQSARLSKSAIDFLVEQRQPAAALNIAVRFVRANPSSAKGWENYLGLCRQSPDSGCASEANAGLKKAQSVFTIDQRPGSRQKRGLFGNIQVQCKNIGEICR